MGDREYRKAQRRSAADGGLAGKTFQRERERCGLVSQFPLVLRRRHLQYEAMMSRMMGKGSRALHEIRDALTGNLVQVTFDMPPAAPGTQVSVILTDGQADPVVEF
jgi:hypothetical protein